MPGMRGAGGGCASGDGAGGGFLVGPKSAGKGRLMHAMIGNTRFTMSISLTIETQQLIEQHMKASGITTADELVRVALQSLAPTRGLSLAELDADTQAAIRQGLEEADRGETRPWAEVKEELRARFMK